ncbi:MULTISPECIES: glycosyltransferase family 39 protein [Trichocoleus]|uniref:glycosyltransferase family 39 protein n=1 Tax=Trichocoleus TaxID=450526 RepID=UPI00199D0212|nr:glycosyltransferase family 39 protein [Trichocoleus sp. FACHB-46]MBD1863740.1 glycosyltransferase family 39 protein [Trichocoleus sp. FACHB-46]
MTFSKWFSSFTWFKALIILTLSLSIIFRFIKLDQKVYTVDEVRGILRIEGYTSQEFTDQVYNGKIISNQEIQRYQYPSLEKSFSDTVKALAGNPEHPPLYYLISRFWIDWLDHPVGARVLSALVSLFIFPALYWLCIELFESPLSGWIAIALVAVSPFYLMLAQEARQYSLWTVFILISSASLLRGLRTLSRNSWIIYTAAIALGLYTHLFFVFVLLTHGLYVLLTEKLKSKPTIFYLIASFCGCITFTPWIWVILSSSSRVKTTTSWVASFKIGLFKRFTYWQANLSSIFSDFNDPKINQLVSFAVLVLVLYAIYFLCRHAPKKVWLFVLLLIGSTALAQIIPDLIWGGRRSILSRYLVPSYLGVHLAVAYLFTQQLFRVQVKVSQQRLWRSIFAVLLSVGIMSCAASAQAKDWWKGSSSINLQVAPLINQAPQPLIISDSNLTFVLPLSYLLKPETQFQLFERSRLEEQNFQTELKNSVQKFKYVFLYSPSKQLLQLLEQMNQPSDYKTTVVVGQSQWFQDRNYLYRIQLNSAVDN